MADEKEVQKPVAISATLRKARPGRKPRTRGRPTSSDAADTRWTLRGVSGVTRSLAIEAAENRNMTVGDWVSEAIVRRFKGQHEDDSSAVPAVLVEKTLAELAERLTALETERKKGLLSRLFRRKLS